MKLATLIVSLSGRWLAMLLFAVIAFGYCVAASVVVGDEPLKAMLVTGGCCHDYDTQKVIITEGLVSQLGAIEWTIHQYADKRDTRATIYDNPDWCKGFDLVVHNECFGAMTDAELVKRIVDGHRTHKVAAVFVHCSMHSYRESSAAEDWREFLGVTSTFHEGAKRPLDVIPTAEGKQLGITSHLNDKWTTPNGELYIIKKVWPETKVLAQAYSTEQKADQPVAWVREEAGVRVFGTTLGHHNETMRTDQWQQMVGNGTRWALHRE